MAMGMAMKPETRSPAPGPSGLGQMETLGRISTNRDNNLNLIRAVAATAVLVSHAYPIALGPGASEPLIGPVGHSLGSLAVYLFFIVSGFLITGSFLRRRDPAAFVTARALRLFPGLAVSLLLVALVMGPMASSLPVGAYLSEPDLWAFLLRNISLLDPLYTLPGVFTENPYPTVEGSIWTLVFEVACYMGVFVLGIAGCLGRPRLMALVLGALLALWLLREIADIPLFYHLHQLLRLGLPFGIGVAAWIWRDRIPMHWVGVIGLAVLSWITRETLFYTPVLITALAYGTFWLAYVPGGFVRRYNRIGDYSYGIYIYAFPCQGLAVWLWGPMDPVTNMLLGFALTLPPSILSWHLVEEPCLRANATVTRWLRRHLDRIRPGKSPSDI